MDTGNEMIHCLQRHNCEGKRTTFPKDMAGMDAGEDGDMSMCRSRIFIWTGSLEKILTVRSIRN